MMTLGSLQRKWVYPTIMILGFLLFFIVFARGGETVPDPMPAPPGQETDDPDRPWRHSENDFINAADDFNQNTHYANLTDLDYRARTQEARMRGARDNWAGTAYSEDNREIARMRNADSRYNQERNRLDDRRRSELNDYREKRRDIQNQMSMYDRQSMEYRDLQRELHELDRGHADEERKFEREFTNMDANFSQSR